MSVLDRRPGLWLGATLALVVVAYLPAFEGDFLWDDDTLVVQNRYIKDWRFLQRNLTHDFWDVDLNLGRKAQRSYYRPVVTLTLMVDHALWGLSPRGFHFSNLVFHLLVVLLFARLARRLAPRAPPWIVALATALFALHPSRGEAVFWISGRTDVVMAIFFLAALLAALRATKSPRPWPWALLTLVFFALALGSKESAVALVAIVPLYEALALGQEGRRRRVLVLHLPLVLFGLAFLAFRLASEGTLGGGVSGLGARVAAVLGSLGHYAALLLWPYQPDALRGIDFDVSRPAWLLLALGAATLSLFAFATWRWWRRRPLWAWALLFCAAALAPAANIVPLPGVSLVAERFTYLPLAGLALLLTLMLVDLRSLESGGARPLGTWAAAGLLVLLLSWAPVSYWRGEDFSSPLRFWSAAEKKHPEHGLPQEHLARIHTRAGRLGQAAKRCRRAMEAYARRGEIQSKVDMQLHLVELDLARLPAASVKALRARAGELAQLSALAAEERSAATRLTLAHLPEQPDRSLELSFGADTPTRAVLRARAGDLLTWRGSLLSRLGEDVAALKSLRLAHRREPRSMPALVQLLLAELRALDGAAAKGTWAKAEALTPGDSKLRSLSRRMRQVLPRILGVAPSGLEREAQLAEIQLMLSAPARAATHLRRVVAARPADRQAWVRLTLTLSTGGAKAEALDVIAEARAHFGDEPGLLALQRRVMKGGGK